MDGDNRKRYDGSIAMQTRSFIVASNLSSTGTDRRKPYDAQAFEFDLIKILRWTVSEKVETSHNYRGLPAPLRNTQNTTSWCIRRVKPRNYVKTAKNHLATWREHGIFMPRSRSDTSGTFRSSGSKSQRSPCPGDPISRQISETRAPCPAKEKNKRKKKFTGI